jgi:hypothetical protein
MIRYMNAAHVLAFSGIGDCAYNDVNFFDHMNSVYKLLTAEELDRIRTIGTSSSSLLLSSLQMGDTKVYEP